MNLRSLRKDIINKRRQLTPLQQRTASHKVALHIAKTPLFLQSQRIAFYFAVNGEINCHSLFLKALQMGKNCYLPVLHPIKHNQLWFVQYRPGDRLIQNCYGIPEPEVNVYKLIPIWSLDLAIIPLVAFDEKGHRLGMGAGYYDRTFSLILKNTHQPKPHLLGVGYELQKVSLLQTQPWDVPLDGIITEKTVYSLLGRLGGLLYD